MSFTLGNGWDEDFGYFSYPSRRGVGQCLHPACNKARNYALPGGFLPGRSAKGGWLRSVRRSSVFRPTIQEARSRLFYRAMNRNPLYYAHIADRPAGALRLGYPYGWYMSAKVQERALQQWEVERQQRYLPAAKTVSITLSRATWEEIEDFLANSEGPAMPENPEERTLEWLVTSLLAHWADGWRRPGSWERSMLDMMGHAND